MLQTVVSRILIVKLVTVLTIMEKQVKLSRVLLASLGMCNSRTNMVLEMLGTTTSVATLTENQEHGAIPPVVTRDGSFAILENALSVTKVLSGL